VDRTFARDINQPRMLFGRQCGTSDIDCFVKDIE